MEKLRRGKKKKKNEKAVRDEVIRGAGAAQTGD